MNANERQRLEQQLQTYKLRLILAEREMVSIGTFAPPYLLTEIVKLRDKVAQIENELGLTKREVAQLSKPSERNQIFISYSHADEKWLKHLQLHLRPLMRNAPIKVWDDTMISPGSNWRDEIKKAIESAKVAILLISFHYLASDFIANEELPPLLTAAEQEGAVIVPVIIGHCRFLQTKSLSRFQAINDPNKPLDSLSGSKRNEVFVKISDAIEKALNTDLHQYQISDKKSPEVVPATATNMPTNTTELMCTVPSMVGKKVNSAAAAWTSAGFTGSFNQVGGNGNWEVRRQSLPAGATVSGDSSVIVYEHSVTSTPGPTSTPTRASTPTPTVTPLTCPQGQGYWKNHPEQWRETALTLGDDVYTQAELLAILNMDDTGDASIALTIQLIAAKLNTAAGIDDSPVATDFERADVRLSLPGRIPYYINNNSASGREMRRITLRLEDFNHGKLTPGCAPTPVSLKGTVVGNRANTVVHLTWSSDASAVKYRVFQSDSTGTVTALGLTMSTSLNDDSVSSNKTYQYYVIAYNAQDQASLPSNTITVHT